MLCPFVVYPLHVGVSRLISRSREPMLLATLLVKMFGYMDREEKNCIDADVFLCGTLHFGVASNAALFCVPVCLCCCVFVLAGYVCVCR